MTDEQGTIEQGAVELVDDTDKVEIEDDPVSDGEYLSLKHITSGKARNIKTVRITTSGGSFCVDVFKKNPLYRIMESESASELFELSKDPDPDRLTYLMENYKDRCAEIIDYIVKPSLEMCEDVVLLHGEKVPGDTLDLLLRAIDLVNKDAADEAAAADFQAVDSEQPE